MFFLGTLTPEQQIGALEEMAANAGNDRENLERLLAATPWDDSDFSRYGRLALEWGLRFARMRQEWAAWSIDRLHQSAAGTGESS